MKITPQKIKDKLLDNIDKIFTKLFYQEINDIIFLKKFLIPDDSFNSPEEFGRYFRRRNNVRFCLNTLNKDEIIKTIQRKFPHILQQIIDNADKINEHYFDLLGSGSIKVSKNNISIVNKSLLDTSYQPIDWHTDFKTGFSWNPRKYYKDIRIPYGEADIKIPWELSRFQHLSTLGEAYWISNKAKYSREFVNQVSDWIGNNPPKSGVNWQCTMDVAIRVCNWILGYSFFKDADEVTDEFLVKFIKSIYQHGRHIRNNLESNAIFTSNHYISNIVGLLYISVFFPELKDAEEWKKFSIEELIKEMRKQIYPDGCDYESSTCYHRLVLELFFYATVLVIINDDEYNNCNYKEITDKVFGEEYTNLLYKMFEAALYLIKPNGKMPQVGDNDSGRFHTFSQAQILDMKYLLTLGSIFFNDSKFKINEFGFSPEAIWVLGNKGYQAWKDLENNTLNDVKSRAFPDAGWYVMRDNLNYCLIVCGPNGQNGNGGHCHNDKLSFELCLGGKDVVIDPGTNVYSSDPLERNTFRGTAYHNTVMIDNREQNDFNIHINRIFQINNDALPGCLKWQIGEIKDIFIGTHTGYSKLKYPVVHQREFIFDKHNGRLEIIDSFEGEGNHQLNWNFILSPGLVNTPIILSDRINWRKEIIYYSPEYGVSVETKKYTSLLKTELPCSIKIIIK